MDVSIYITTHNHITSHSLFRDICRWNVSAVDSRVEKKTVAYAFARALGLSEASSQLVILPSPEKTAPVANPPTEDTTADTSAETVSVGIGVYLTASSTPFRSSRKFFALH